MEKEGGEEREKEGGEERERRRGREIKEGGEVAMSKASSLNCSTTRL